MGTEAGTTHHYCHPLFPTSQEAGMMSHTFTRRGTSSSEKVPELEEGGRTRIPKQGTFPGLTSDFMSNIYLSLHFTDFISLFLHFSILEGGTHLKVLLRRKENHPLFYPYFVQRQNCQDYMFHSLLFKAHTWHFFLHTLTNHIKFSQR